MLARLVNLSIRCHRLSTCQAQPLLLVVGLQRCQTRAFQQCSTLRRDSSDHTGAAPTQEEGKTDIKQLRRSPLSSFRQSRRPSYSKESPEAQDEVTAYLRPEPRRSGYGWTVVADKGQLTSLKHTLKQMPFSMLSAYEKPLLVILHSSQAEKTNELEEMAFQILTRNNRLQQGMTVELQVLTAFVDKVSVPTKANGIISMDEISDGAHGYSFWWTSQEKLRVPFDNTVGRNSDRVQGSLGIYINHKPSTPNADLSPFSRFRIPLVNTTFITGHDYTMDLKRMTWRNVKKQQDEGWSFDSHSVEDIQHLGNQIAILEIDTSQEMLMPQGYSYEIGSKLTPWRRAVDVSGNVIKTLQGPDSPLPASTELEKAIAGLDSSEYGQFEVWAEICFHKDDVQDKRIAGSCRYVKVISGGGGWGEKRGLIALDPGPAVESSSEAQHDLPDELDFTKMLPNILDPGDELRFWKFPIDQVDHEEIKLQASAAKPTPVCVSTNGWTSFGFGTTGNPESESAELYTHNSDSNALRTQTIFGHFGAMTQRMHYEYAELSLSADETDAPTPQQSHATNLPPFTYLGSSNIHFATPSDPILHRKSHKDPREEPEPKERGISNSLYTPSSSEFVIRKLPSLSKNEQDVLSKIHYHESLSTDTVETSAWAQEEKTILANLQENAPLADQDSELVIREQEDRIRELFGDGKEDKVKK